MARKSKQPKPTGYYLEIFHRTPSGELRRTLMKYSGPQSKSGLEKIALQYESLLMFRAPHVNEYLGYVPTPQKIRLRNQFTQRVVRSWKRAA